VESRSTTATVMIKEGVDLEMEMLVSEAEEDGEMTSMRGIHLERNLSDLDQVQVGVVGSEGTVDQIEADLAADLVDSAIAEVIEAALGVASEAVREGAILSRDETGGNFAASGVPHRRL